MFIMFCMLQISLGQDAIELLHLGSVYVPFEYGGGGAPDTFRYNDGVAEQLAVEKDRFIAYTIGML